MVKFSGQLIKHILVFFFLSGACNFLFAQTEADSGYWRVQTPEKYSFISYSRNVITQGEYLDPVMEKLRDCQLRHSGVVRIIHIGDSHLQADMITNILRNGFQDYFGNCGRGIVFPYQLAKSNAPADIVSSSSVSWQYNRLAHPEISIVTGITGFGIHSTSAHASVSMQLKPVNGMDDYFNRISFFLGNDAGCYQLSAPGLQKKLFAQSVTGKYPTVVINADTSLTGFELSRCEGDTSPFDFYGVSLERANAAGVLYHTIGVNGAQYEQYTHNDLFWSQLKSLNGDLFILSLGTNEAQNQHLDEDRFILKCDSFVNKVRMIAPHAVILITTPAGSYFQQKSPNRALHYVSDGLVSYCRQNKIAYWDLFNISDGVNGTDAWKKNGLFSHDLVHYNKQGYELQGSLFLNALAAAYNKYVLTHPAKRKSGFLNLGKRRDNGDSMPDTNDAAGHYNSAADTIINNPIKPHPIKTGDR